MNLTASHVRILRHTLGMTTPTMKPWRNHFVAGEGHADMPKLNELTVSGHLDVRDNPGGSGYLYRVTDLGRKVAMDIESPMDVALTVGQKAVADRVASYLWRRNGRPEKDSEPTSVGLEHYTDISREVVGAMATLGIQFKLPDPVAKDRVEEFVTGLVELGYEIKPIEPGVRTTTDRATRKMKG